MDVLSATAAAAVDPVPAAAAVSESTPGSPARAARPSAAPLAQIPVERVADTLTHVVTATLDALVCANHWTVSLAAVGVYLVLFQQAMLAAGPGAAAPAPSLAASLLLSSSSSSPQKRQGSHEKGKEGENDGSSSPRSSSSNVLSFRAGAGATIGASPLTAAAAAAAGTATATGPPRSPSRSGSPPASPRARPSEVLHIAEDLPPRERSSNGSGSGSNGLLPPPSSSYSTSAPSSTHGNNNTIENGNANNTILAASAPYIDTELVEMNDDDEEEFGESPAGTVPALHFTLPHAAPAAAPAAPALPPARPPLERDPSFPVLAVAGYAAAIAAMATHKAPLNNTILEPHVLLGRDTLDSAARYDPLNGLKQTLSVAPAATPEEDEPIQALLRALRTSPYPASDPRYDPAAALLSWARQHNPSVAHTDDSYDAFKGLVALIRAGEAESYRSGEEGARAAGHQRGKYDLVSDVLRWLREGGTGDNAAAQARWCMVSQLLTWARKADLEAESRAKNNARRDAAAGRGRLAAAAEEDDEFLRYDLVRALVRHLAKGEEEQRYKVGLIASVLSDASPSSSTGSSFNGDGSGSGASGQKGLKGPMGLVSQAIYYLRHADEEAARNGGDYAYVNGSGTGSDGNGYNNAVAHSSASPSSSLLSSANGNASYRNSNGSGNGNGNGAGTALAVRASSSSSAAASPASSPRAPSEAGLVPFFIHAGATLYQAAKVLSAPSPKKTRSAPTATPTPAAAPDAPPAAAALAAEALSAKQWIDNWRRRHGTSAAAAAAVTSSVPATNGAAAAVATSAAVLHSENEDGDSNGEDVAQPSSFPSTISSPPLSSFDEDLFRTTEDRTYDSEGVA
jgi:hypothetical protein